MNVNEYINIKFETKNLDFSSSSSSSNKSEFEKCNDSSSTSSISDSSSSNISISTSSSDNSTEYSNKCIQLNENYYSLVSLNNYNEYLSIISSVNSTAHPLSTSTSISSENLNLNHHSNDYYSKLLIIKNKFDNLKLNLMLNEIKYEINSLFDKIKNDLELDLQTKFTQLVYEQALLNAKLAAIQCIINSNNHDLKVFNLF